MMGNSLIVEQVKLPKALRYDGEYTVELDNINIECFYVVHDFGNAFDQAEVEILSTNVSLGGSFEPLPLRALGHDLLRVLEDEVRAHVEASEAEAYWERKR
jgi:hypothetical protein